MPTPLERCQNANSIGQFLKESAEHYQGNNAFNCGPMTLSYSELLTQAHSFSAYLQSQGIGKGDRVALMAPNLPAFPIATLGMLSIGAIQVNVNPLYTATELLHQLNDSGAETLIVFSGSSASYAKIKDSCPIKKVIVVSVSDGTQADLPSPPHEDAISEFTPFAEALRLGAKLDYSDPGISREDLAFLQYTGGTTGPSKGAMLTHDNILSNMAQYYECSSKICREGQEVIVTAIPMYHIFALVVNFLIYAGCGSRNVLITNPRDMDSFVKSVKNSGFSVITGVNALFAGLMAHPDFASSDFSNLTACVNGGTAAMEATSDKWQSITGLPLIQGYGLSETSPILTFTSSSVRTFTGKVGTAFPRTDIKLLDNEDQEVAIGLRGELVAKGPQVTQGYYEKPEATAAAFTDDGYFRTGDIAIKDEAGNYQIVDRKKDMIIVSGFNVYPNDVEQVAAKCKGVLECACIGIPDDITGEAVKLFAVRDSSGTVTEPEIIAHCREHLTAYKVPKAIEFIDEVPKSAVGKMLRRMLRDL